MATTNSSSFDASKYVRKLGGKDYLEVKWRLVWLRTEHPDAAVHTELARLEDGFALFKAHVSIPGGGEATGWGSETRQDFPDFIEKAETKALGRALAALGFGTQFCEDFATVDGNGDTHPVDSPVDQQATNSGSAPRPAADGPHRNGGGSLATPAQLKLMYLVATRDLHIGDAELEEMCHERYGRLPVRLTKREASQFIDQLRAEAK